MRLIIENRTPHRAEISHVMPDTPAFVSRKQHRTSIPPHGETVLPLTSDLSGATEHAIATVLDDLAVYGLTASDGVNRYNAARNPMAPEWRGLCYRIEP